LRVGSGCFDRPAHTLSPGGKRTAALFYVGQPRTLKAGRAKGERVIEVAHTGWAQYTG